MTTSKNSTFLLQDQQRGINSDRNPDSRDTRVGGNNSNKMPSDLGKIIPPIDSATTSSVPPPSVGALVAAPASGGVEAPTNDPAEMAQRVERNKGFLAQPEVQAGLLQFALSIMSPGGDFANAMGSGFEAAGNVKTNRDAMSIENRKLAQEDRKLSQGDRQLNIDEAAAKAKGGMKFSRIIRGDDPLNKRFGLGLAMGDTAKVEFTSDVSGKVINASVDSSFGTQEKTPEIVTLRNKALELRAAGDTKGADLLDQQAQTLAAGVSGVGARSVPDASSPTGYKTVYDPGSKGALEIQDRIDAKVLADEAKVNQAQIVLDRVDKAINMIQNSVAPDILVTGFGDFLQYIPGTDAKDFAETISTIRANNTINKLTQMRENSKSGASGLGQVTEFEDKMLGAATGSLEQGQSSGQMLENLKTVRGIYDAIINTGTLHDIGKRVDKGEITYQQGVQEAAGMMASSGPETQHPTDKGEQAIPLPDKLPQYTDSEMARIRPLWQGMSNTDRQKFINAP